MSVALPFTGHTQNSLLHVLLRSDRALITTEIAERLGVTKTAARQHVLNLQTRGYVQISTPEHEKQVRPGRPVYAYELSAEGRELFTRHYALFSGKMIQMMSELLGEDQLKQQMQMLGASIAEDLQHRMPAQSIGRPTPDVLDALAELMRELGYDAKHNGDNEISAQNCVFHKLAEANEQVCETDLSLMHKLTGKKPKHLECMVRGGHACRFKF